MCTNTEDKFAMGVDSMCRSCICAIEAVKAGTMTLDAFENWLKLVLLNEPTLYKEL